MVGRKQRGPSRGGRAIDRGRGRSRGRGRGRGQYRSQDDAGIQEIDAAFDDVDSRPRGRRNITRAYAEQVTSIYDSGQGPRNEDPVRGTTIFRRGGFRNGRGWRGGHFGPDSSSQKERAQVRHLEPRLRYGQASLSQLLHEDRPLLKPISFVRSKHTPTLFLTEEEIFKPVVEKAGEQGTSHVPTAERVFRIFHGDKLHNSSEPPSDVEELLEIDFTDLDRIMKQVEGLEAAASSSKKTTSAGIENAEDQSTIAKLEERFKEVILDTKSPSLRHLHLPTNSIPVEHPGTRTLGEDMDNDDDEIIVYPAPHPRNGKLPPGPIQSSSAIAVPSVDSEPIPTYRRTSEPQHEHVSTSLAHPNLQCVSEPSSSTTPPPLKVLNASLPPISGPDRPATRAQSPRHIFSRRMNRCAAFSAFGAIRAEAALHEVDPRRDEQRRGDSDVDWGGSTSEESADDGGMLVDQDVDAYAMEAFVKGMNPSGLAHVSADDLEEDDDEESRAESDDGADSTELELAGDAQDVLMPVSEDEYESTSDEEETPKRSFQARLERLRKRTKGRPIEDVLDDELDPDLEADEEDSIVAKIQDFLHENDEILRAQDRTQRNRIFQAIHQGDFDMDEIDFVDGPARRKKNKFIPNELRDQWERDRAKKAQRKRLRELERMAAAMDPFTTPKGGKKARKAKRAAALATSLSLETIAGHMRRFVADIGGPRTLPLPPMDRKMRKSVHELAHAFKLESKSQGNGAGRFTTVKKTTFSGGNVNEKKIAQLLRKSPSFASRMTHKGEKGKGKIMASRMRPRDGEVVGETAPKLDGKNIGFQMLSAMGWEEGDQIGLAGGLEAPLVAVVKTTKLGLGASKGC